MKPRERVEMALKHEKPDRCPFQSSFTPEFAHRLGEALGIKNATNLQSGGNKYILERAIGEDMLITSVGWANSYYMDTKPYTDEWGVGWRIVPYETIFGTGIYTEVCRHPLAMEAAINSYHPPDATRPELYQASEQVVKDYGDEYWIVGAVVTTIFETAWALRGLKQILVDMANNPDLADALFDISHHYHLIAAKKLVALGIDMIYLGDDMGGQKHMLISPEMWCRYFKTRMGDFISELKMINPRLKIAYHSDGAIESIIPDLIDIGVDVLNPIQPQSMDPAKIKNKYGDQLSFWGTIDEQYTLPFGTPQDVMTEIKLRLESVGYNGGLILAPTHAVQLDTPIQNFLALVAAINPSWLEELRSKEELW